MEVYLNVAETGEGIYGIDAASREYFRKPARALTKKESALLTVSLPNPRIWPLYKPTRLQYGKQQWILQRLNKIYPDKPETTSPLVP